ncbi:tetratricopeptide repeat protein [Litorimonas sp.]|uniref:tetratricopeptide repeat protein n=1 Tax=Litorimonas sp. TaxID=1892381 RepID=UPI003A89B875
MFKNIQVKSLILICLTASLCLASPAQAQSKRELAAQNAQLAQRVSILEQRLLTGDPAAERLMARMDSLETSQRSLTGEIERLRYERENLVSELDALEGDIRVMQELSNRIRIHLDAVDLVVQETQGREESYEYGPKIDGQPSAIPGAPVYEEKELVIGEETTISEPEMPLGEDVSQLGQIGKTKLAEGDFAGAQVSLSQYLEFNPDAADAGEMSFWLGESYFVRGGYADAADAYIASMRKNPDGEKAPNAMVRLAAALRELGKTAEACQTLASFPNQFPDAREAVREKANVEAARTGC